MSQWTFATVNFQPAQFDLILHDRLNESKTEFYAGEKIHLQLFRGSSATPYTISVTDAATGSAIRSDVVSVFVSDSLKFADEEAKSLPRHRYTALSYTLSGITQTPVVSNGVFNFGQKVSGNVNYFYKPIYDHIVIKNTGSITERTEIIVTVTTNSDEYSAELSIPIKTRCEEDSKYCLNQTTCEDAGWYWYDDACHEDPPREDIDDEEDCEATGGYWYDEECHDEPLDECADDYEKCYDQADCEAAGWYWYDGECHETPDTTPLDYEHQVVNIYSGDPVSGASVYLNGTLKGTTDNDGMITLSGVVPGTTYAIKVTATNYTPTDEDTIANDTLTIPGS